MRASCVLADYDPNRSSRLPDELRGLARSVHAIGFGYRTVPESIAVAKDMIATRLLAIVRDLECGMIKTACPQETGHG